MNLRVGKYEMNKDAYEEVVNGIDTSVSIATELLNTGKCIIGWTDQTTEHRDILFTYAPRHLGGELQRGLRWCFLYVSIMGFSSMGFLIEEQTDNRKNNEYIKEKLHLRDNHCDNAICDLINDVIEQLDLYK